MRVLPSSVVCSSFSQVKDESPKLRVISVGFSEAKDYFCFSIGDVKSGINTCLGYAKKKEDGCYYFYKDKAQKESIGCLIELDQKDKAVLDLSIQNKISVAVTYEIKKT